MGKYNDWIDGVRRRPEADAVITRRLALGRRNRARYLLDAAKWIGSLFTADGAGIHMAGVDNHIVGQAEQFGLNATDQGVETAAGQIRPADGSGKQCVTDEYGLSGI